MASVGLGLGLTWMTIAYLAVRLERRSFVYAFYALSVVSPVEIIWNIVRVSVASCNASSASANEMHFTPRQLLEAAHVAQSLLISTFICGSVAILTRALSVYTMHRVSKNFGEGIKDLSK